MNQLANCVPGRSTKRSKRPAVANSRRALNKRSAEAHTGRESRPCICTRNQQEKVLMTKKWVRYREKERRPRRSMGGDAKNPSHIPERSDHNTKNAPATLYEYFSSQTIGSGIQRNKASYWNDARNQPAPSSNHLLAPRGFGS